MRTRFWIHSAMLVAASAIAAALAVASAEAQQFSPWSAPVNLNNLPGCPAVVNSTSDDQHPAISKDGLSLYFTSNRPGGSGNFDLWVTQRDSLDDCWLPPVNLGPGVNTPSLESAPNLTTDGHWLYFHSKPPTWLRIAEGSRPTCTSLIGKTSAMISVGKPQLTWAAQLTRRVLTTQALRTSRTIQRVLIFSISRSGPSVRAMSSSTFT